MWYPSGRARFGFDPVQGVKRTPGTRVRIPPGPLAAPCPIAKGVCEGRRLSTLDASSGVSAGSVPTRKSERGRPCLYRARSVGLACKWRFETFSAHWSAGRSIAVACNPREARHLRMAAVCAGPGSLGLQAVEEVRGTPPPHAQRSAGGRLTPIEPQRHRRGAISSVTGVRACPGESSGERERTAGGQPPRQMMDALIGYRTPAIGRHSSTATKGQAMTVR